MLRWSSLPRPLLAALATLFAAAAILYGFLWMYDARHPNNRVELGFNRQHNTTLDEATHSISILDVVPSSPAERAGLRVYDRIVAVDGKPLNTIAPFYENWSRSRPGDAVEMTIARDSEPRPIILHGIFRSLTSGGDSGCDLDDGKAVLLFEENLPPRFG
jgi:membrane-associated protease RseP (regulator of RpoE activity)